jgi:ferredoxin
MVIRTLRKVVKIDEEKCNGCGACVLTCAEGALQIVNGKAKLISEQYCDGLGACLGECPQGAIIIEERVADDFSEEAVGHHLKTRESLPCGCLSSTVAQFDKGKAAGVVPRESGAKKSMLSHWPVQLALVPPRASFLQGADLVLAADCVSFAYSEFHRDFLSGRSLLIACPKLDDFQAHLSKLAEILSQSAVKSLTVVHMEVPCCSGLVYMARQAIKVSDKDIPLAEATISIQGEKKA